MWVYVYKAHLNPLSKSIQGFEKEFKPMLKQMNDMSMDIYPTPNMVKMVEETAQEFLKIELHLTRNNKTKFGKAMIAKVVEGTIKTYPFINKEFITLKIVSMFESMIGDDAKAAQQTEESNE